MTQVYYVAASLDGFIAGPNGELDWLHAFETPGNDYGYAQFLAQRGCAGDGPQHLRNNAVFRRLALRQAPHVAADAPRGVSLRAPAAGRAGQHRQPGATARAVAGAGPRHRAVPASAAPAARALGAPVSHAAGPGRADHALQNQ